MGNKDIFKIHFLKIVQEHAFVTISEIFNLTKEF